MEFTIAECLHLEAEINGHVDQNGKVVIKGLLNEPLSLKTKYWILKMSKKLAAEKKAFTESRDAIIKALGEQKEDGSYQIPVQIDGKANENYLEFNRQLEEALNEKADIEFDLFDIENFDFQSDSSYGLFLEKCIKDNQQ